MGIAHTRRNGHDKRRLPGTTRSALDRASDTRPAPRVPHAAVAAYSSGGGTLSDNGNPDGLVTVQATRSLATVLRVRPALGRWFVEEEGVSGAPPVAVLSHGLWASRYGRDPNIVGQSIR